MEFESFKQEFADRLRFLRNEQKCSAREMSLALGQNVNYINYIENGKHLPSMQGFFSICEFFKIQPADFFARQTEPPVLSEDRATLLEIYDVLKKRLSECAIIVEK